MNPKRGIVSECGNLGDYQITQNMLSAGTNYAIAFTPGTLTVVAPTVRVTGVTPTKNRSGAVTAVTITFSGALDATSANTKGNYHLTPVGKGAKPIPVKLAQYVATPNSFTVKLTPSKPFTGSNSKHVQLWFSGLADSLHRPVANQGSGYVWTL